MANDALVFHSLASSNMPSLAKKSLMEKWVEGISGTGMARVKSHALATGHAIRQSGESAVVGAALAALEVELPTGLDVSIPLGSKTIVAPIDGLVALAGIAGGIAFSNEEVGTDLRNAGAAALTILTFRKTYGFLAAKKRLAGGTPGGSIAGEFAGEDHSAQSTEDPIVAQARAMTA
jgi:hypothetical protein